MEIDNINTPIKSLNLNFNLSCWQNRRARIYLEGENVPIKTKNKIVHNVNIPIDLVLEHREESKIIKYNQRNIYLFLKDINHHRSFFQLQVWKNDGINQVLFKTNDDDENSPTLRLEKIGVNRNRIFCTIDCDKGLKVQKLFLIGILKYNNTIYISDETLFPPPSSKRKFISSNHENSSSVLNDLSIESKTSQAFDQWNLLSDSLDSYNSTGTFYHLTRSLEFTADLDGRDLNSSKIDVLGWLNFGHFTLKDKIFYGIVDNIVELWQQRYFFAAISSVTSKKLLTDVFNKTKQSHFLIRFSMTRKPYFDLDGIYMDKSSVEPIYYKALIMYDIDEVTRKAVYWIETRNDKKASRCFSLPDIISYITLTTSWKPLSADFYDKSGLPTNTTTLSLQRNITPTVPHDNSLMIDQTMMLDMNAHDISSLSAFYHTNPQFPLYNTSPPPLMIDERGEWR